MLFSEAQGTLDPLKMGRWVLYSQTVESKRFFFWRDSFLLPCLAPFLCRSPVRAMIPIGHLQAARRVMVNRPAGYLGVDMDAHEPFISMFLDNCLASSDYVENQGS